MIPATFMLGRLGRHVILCVMVALVPGLVCACARRATPHLESAPLHEQANRWPIEGNGDFLEVTVVGFHQTSQTSMCDFSAWYFRENPAVSHANLEIYDGFCPDDLRNLPTLKTVQGWINGHPMDFQVKQCADYSLVAICNYHIVTEASSINYHRIIQVSVYADDHAEIMRLISSPTLITLRFSPRPNQSLSGRS